MEGWHLEKLRKEATSPDLTKQTIHMALFDTGFCFIFWSFVGLLHILFIDYSMAVELD